MSTAAKKFPLVLPPPVEGMNSDLTGRELSNNFDLFTIEGLSMDENAEPETRILVALRGA